MHTSLPLLHAAALASLLVDSLWQAVAFVIVVAALLTLLPTLSATVRSAVWTGVLLALSALPLLELALPHPGVSVHGLHAAHAAGALLVALWAGGSTFRLMQLGLGAHQLRMLLRRATPLEPSPEITHLLDSGPRRVQLCLCADIEKPSVAGFLRPRILLPPALLEQLASDDLRHIVLHELAHLRRRDDWVNLLQQISLVLLPLNPVLFWLNRRISLERELACDDDVLAGTCAPRAYALCLARLAESTLVQRGVSLALGLLGRSPELVIRVERLLQPVRPGMNRLQSRVAVAMLLMVVLGGAGLLAHSPELVSFSAAPSMLAQSDTPLALPFGVTIPAVANSPLGFGHIQLAKAVLAPERPTLRVVKNHRPGRLGLHRASRPGSHAPRLLLTGWSAASTEELPDLPHYRLTRITVSAEADPQVWYTAIAWRDGWLVVQL